MCGQHKYWMVKRWIVSPPAVPALDAIFPRAGVAAKHIASHDCGADVGKRCRNNGRALGRLPAFQAMGLAPFLQRKCPVVQCNTANAKWIVSALIGTSDIA